MQRIPARDEFVGLEFDGSEIDCRMVIGVGDTAVQQQLGQLRVLLAQVGRDERGLVLHVRLAPGYQLPEIVPGPGARGH